MRLESTINQALELFFPDGAYDWQKRFFQRLCEDRWPSELDIPTGLGKTSVIALWLLAHLYHPETANRPPMRLIYVVNRRTIIDQATAIVEELRQKLDENQELRYAWSVKFGRSPLAISTLRGARADNLEWLVDCATPAVIIGTVDMIGSRLLFSGYRTGRWQSSRHAGLLGIDSVLVHDEAHLTPVFGKLARWIESYQRDSKFHTIPGVQPLRVLEMTGTPSSTNTNGFTLNSGDEQEIRVRQRLKAKKTLVLHECKGDDKALHRRFVDKSLEKQHDKLRVIVFVTSPDSAKKIKDEIDKKLGTKQRTALLTGTIRGAERDELVQSNPVMRYFLEAAKPDNSIYLVSTSAGEVGVDLDADHMICDLTSLDSLAQRLGRLNRRGDRDEADIHLIRREKKKTGAEASDPAKGAASSYSIVLEQAWDFLRARSAEFDGNAIDVSPYALRTWRSCEHYSEACSPIPLSKTPSEITLDSWCMTSIEDNWPLQEDVQSYLHGLEDYQPQTTLLWREELNYLNQETEESISAALANYRILPRETVQTDSLTAMKVLKGLAKRHPRQSIARIEGSKVEFYDLCTIDHRERQIVNATIILPSSVGGLGTDGVLSNESTASSDVGDCPDGSERRTRIFLKKKNDEWAAEYLVNNANFEAEESDCLLSSTEYFSLRNAIIELENRLRLRCTNTIPLTKDDDGNDDSWILVFKARITRERALNEAVTLEAHHNAAEEEARKIVSRVGIQDRRIVSAVTIAARMHDLGKSRNVAKGVWQEAIGNESGDDLAKSHETSLNPRLLKGYRHELGSLLVTLASRVLEAENTDMDIALYLIAAHHGRSRPHFRAEALKHFDDSLDGSNGALGSAVRFERLHRKYGPWMLAWMEAVLMSADAKASRRAFTSEGDDESSYFVEEQ